MYSIKDISFFLSFFICYLSFPNVGLTTKCPWPVACSGSNRLWTRRLDRYTRAGLAETVVSTMSGPLSETTQDRTQTKDLPSPRIEIKIQELARN